MNSSLNDIGVETLNTCSPQEKHLKEAIETRQFYGSQGASFIPTPEVTVNKETAHRVYRQDVVLPEEYIRMSGRPKMGCIGGGEAHGDVAIFSSHPWNFNKLYGFCI